MSIQAETASAHAALQRCTLARESLDCWLHKLSDQQLPAAAAAEDRHNLVCLVRNLTVRLQQLRNASPLLLQAIDVQQVGGQQYSLSDVCSQDSLLSYETCFGLASWLRLIMLLQ
jgi:hypothetical protein